MRALLVTLLSVTLFSVGAFAQAANEQPKIASTRVVAVAVKALKQFNALSRRLSRPGILQTCTCQLAGGGTSCVNWADNSQCAQIGRETGLACSYSAAGNC